MTPQLKVKEISLPDQDETVHVRKISGRQARELQAVLSKMAEAGKERDNARGVELLCEACAVGLTDGAGEANYNVEQLLTWPHDCLEYAFEQLLDYNHMTDDSRERLRGNLNGTSKDAPGSV